jgi:hypothetical protein
MIYHPLNALNSYIVNPARMTLAQFPLEVQDSWRQAKSLNLELFDGNVFNLIEVNENSIIIQKIDYGLFYVKSKSPKLLPDLEVCVLAVSGITFIGDRVLIGKRSNRVNQFKGKWEMVPSGILDDTDHHKSSLNHIAVDQLCLEFQQETSINSDLLTDIKFLGLVVDSQAYTADLVFRTQIDSKKFFEKYQCDELKSIEYSSFKLVNPRFLRFLSRFSLNFVPTSRFIIRILKI